jgi:hypothetical protein
MNMGALVVAFLVLLFAFMGWVGRAFVLAINEMIDEDPLQ